MTERATMPTPIGTLEVTVEDGFLVHVDFIDARADGPATGGDPAGVVSALEAYFAGDIEAIDRIPVRGAGTPFQQEVWAALRRIPAGETVSYAELAAMVGNAKAMRAVGQANGRNPTGVVVPCHRVIRADGSIGGYTGGLDRKRWLLDHERRHRFT